MAALAATVASAAITSGDQSGDLWSWFYENVTVQGFLNITGLTLLVVLFSRDLILTKGQHERRVADLMKAHEEAMQAKDDRYADMVKAKDESYSEMRASRDYYRDAVGSGQAQRQALIDQLMESNRGLQVSARALGALEQVLPNGEAP